MERPYLMKNHWSKRKMQTEKQMRSAGCWFVGLTRGIIWEWGHGHTAAGWLSKNGQIVWSPTHAETLSHLQVGTCMNHGTHMLRWHPDQHREVQLWCTSYGRHHSASSQHDWPAGQTLCCRENTEIRTYVRLLILCAHHRTNPGAK